MLCGRALPLALRLPVDADGDRAYTLTTGGLLQLEPDTLTCRCFSEQEAKVAFVLALAWLHGKSARRTRPGDARPPALAAASGRPSPACVCPAPAAADDEHVQRAAVVQLLDNTSRQAKQLMKQVLDLTCGTFCEVSLLTARSRMPCPPKLRG